MNEPLNRQQEIIEREMRKIEAGEETYRRLNEIARRKRAQAHAGEVVPGSGISGDPWRKDTVVLREQHLREQFEKAARKIKRDPQNEERIKEINQDRI